MEKTGEERAEAEETTTAAEKGLQEAKAI